MGQIYRRTAAGRTAFMFDSHLMMEYRIVLAVLEVDTPSAHFRNLLPSYPESKIRQWLGELAELGLVQASPSAA